MDFQRHRISLRHGMPAADFFSRMVMGKSEQSQKKIAKWIGISALWCLSFVLIGYVAMIEDLQVTQSSNLIFEIMALSDHTWILYLTYIVMMAAAMGDAGYHAVFFIHHHHYHLCIRQQDFREQIQ